MCRKLEDRQAGTAADGYKPEEMIRVVQEMFSTEVEEGGVPRHQDWQKYIAAAKAR
jgi:hypothetical protein